MPSDDVDIRSQTREALAAAKDSAVVCSIALQFGVPVEVIRKALLRDSQGGPSGPLGAVLDRLAEEDGL
jgi:hypothetical protein